MKDLTKQVRALALFGKILAALGGLGCLFYLVGTAKPEAGLYLSIVYVTIGLVALLAGRLCGALLQRIKVLEAQVQ
jgi:hypothetical protein